jgi:3-hydroxybutyryl-CoA dehydrogenase
MDRVGVVGAGIMGGGIAQVCAVAGLEVSLADVSMSALDKSLAAIEDSLARMVKKGKLTDPDKVGTLARIHTTTSYEAFGESDLVIEAVTENLPLKKEILGQIDAHVTPAGIIATNTSSLSVTELAASVARPEQFIGMHFFNPVPVMNLVELVVGIRTSTTTIETVRALALRLGKTPITAKNSPGFAVNRILCPMINEAIFALQEGLATAKDIDTAMNLGCNHPIGPLALADMIGLDTLLAILTSLHEGIGDPKYRPAPVLREMVAAGLLGRKSGRGFFQYS